jgi:hypothetical protein
MSVYLDDANILWRGKRWCHLYADSLAELETFAREIGLRPAWLQHPDGKAGLPHYDVTGMRLQAARELGATLVTGGDGNYVRLRRMLTRGEYPLDRVRNE